MTINQSNSAQTQSEAFNQTQSETQSHNDPIILLEPTTPRVRKREPGPRPDWLRVR